MYGATQVGLPVLRFCFNNDLGFTNTVNQVIGDTAYKLTLAPGGYMFDGKVLPFKSEDRTIRVKQGDGSLKDESCAPQCRGRSSSSPTATPSPCAWPA
jgi:acyl-homoserine-lactone acylase